MSENTFSREVYSDPNFWEEQFQKTAQSPGEGMFDWYLGWGELKKYLLLLMIPPKKSQVLMVGCGNSRLTYDMYKSSWKQITNIDISQSVIDTMQKWHDKKGVVSSEVSWMVMDATNMSFEEQVFDVVVDKGTVDALMSGNELTSSVKLLQESLRVLKPQGSIILISHGSWKTRGELLKNAFNPKEVSIQFKKQKLSAEANLINIMRSKGKGLSLKQVIKNGPLFNECLKEWKTECSQKDQSSPGMESIDLAKEIGKLEEPSPETCIEQQTNEAENSGEKANLGYNPLRQNYCYVYVIKKL